MENPIVPKVWRFAKRLVLTLIAIVALLAIVLGVNTARFTSRQVHVAPAERIELDARQLAERLSRAIQFRTISHEDASQIDAEAFNALREYLAATMFSGGVQENVLPTAARAVVNFRILPGDSVESVLEHVRQTIDDPRVEVRELVRRPLLRSVSGTPIYGSC